jgi:hypothetical protein
MRAEIDEGLWSSVVSGQWLTPRAPWRERRNGAQDATGVKHAVVGCIGRVEERSNLQMLEPEQLCSGSLSASRGAHRIPTSASQTEERRTYSPRRDSPELSIPSGCHSIRQSDRVS